MQRVLQLNPGLAFDNALTQVAVADDQDIMDDRTSIEWVTLQGTECLRFRFKGHLDGNGALRMIDEWKGYFAARPQKKVILVWDCLNMERYDSEARKYWTRATKEMKFQIQEVWVVTRSSSIKMGASIVAMISQIKIKVVDSEEKVLVD